MKISISSPRFESPLATLRRKTGFALNLCKKALSVNENDVNQAEKWLKEEAKRNGWQKAVQLQNRRAVEGLVGVYVNSSSRSGVLLEVNCESDFVSRNDIFRNLVSDLTLKIASATIVKGKVATPSPISSGLSKYPIEGSQLEPLKDSLATAITQLGENIKLSRATLIQNMRVDGPEAVKLIGYAHAIGGQANSLNGVSIGKYGTILAFTEIEPTRSKESAGNAQGNETLASESEDPDAFAELEQETSLMSDSTSREQVGRLLCQHIIGLNPTCISKAKKEEASKDAHEEESEALLEQKFLVNETITVKQLCLERGMAIVDFERFECGQHRQESDS
jgi:elongation factor Ts